MDEQTEKMRKAELRAVEDRIKELQHQDSDELPVLKMSWRMLQAKAVRHPVECLKWLREKKARVIYADDRTLDMLESHPDIFKDRGCILLSLRIPDTDSEIKIDLGTYHIKKGSRIDISAKNRGHSFQLYDFYDDRFFDLDGDFKVVGGMRWLIWTVLRLYMVSEYGTILEKRVKVMDVNLLNILKYELWLEQTFHSVFSGGIISF